MAKDRAFVVISCTKTNKILMLCTRKGKKRKWGFPGGRIGKREHPTIGILREVKEETGLDLNILELVDTVRDINHNIHIYTSRMYAEHDVTISREHTGYKWVPRFKLPLLRLNRAARFIRESNVI